MNNHYRDVYNNEVKIVEGRTELARHKIKCLIERNAPHEELKQAQAELTNCELVSRQMKSIVKALGEDAFKLINNKLSILKLLID